MCSTSEAAWYGQEDVSELCRMVKKAVQQGRSERKAEAYSVLYVEGLSDARTKLADFFNILLRGAR